jgi:hypothetical protein
MQIGAARSRLPSAALTQPRVIGAHRDGRQGVNLLYR